MGVYDGAALPRPVQPIIEDIIALKIIEEIISPLFDDVF